MARQKEDFYDKLKRYAEKTENLMDGQVEKLKKSLVIDDIDGYINKAGDFEEDKIDKFKKSDVPDKVDDFVEKTEKKAGEVIKNSQETVYKISEKVDGSMDDILKRSSKKSEKPSDCKTD